MRKRKRIEIITVVAFATILGFVAGDMNNPEITKAGVSMTVEEYTNLEEECEENNISFTFVKSVIETDYRFGIKTNKETIVSELMDYFIKYEDPYAVLMCHHYGEEEAVKKTESFNSYINDEYIDTFYEIESINIEL